MEYAESRPYQTGDDVRSIDWRVTARTARTHTKLYEEERERPVWLCVDLRSSMRFATRNAFKSVLASHVAALLAWSALAQGDRIGGVCWTDSGLLAIPPRRGRAALNALFAMMIRAGLTASDSVDEPHSRHSSSLHQVLASGGSAASIEVFSDFMSFDRHELNELSSFAQRQRCRLVQVIDPIEDDPPPIAGAWLIDASGQFARLDPHGISPERAPARQMRERLLALPSRSGLELATAHTTETPEAIARRMLMSAASGRGP
jgi:uncharacterized protein (DUF58 family)